MYAWFLNTCMLIVCEAFCGFHLNFRENVKIELGSFEYKKIIKFNKLNDFYKKTQDIYKIYPFVCISVLYFLKYFKIRLLSTLLALDIKIVVLIKWSNLIELQNRILALSRCLLYSTTNGYKRESIAYWYHISFLYE